MKRIMLRPRTWGALALFALIGIALYPRMAAMAEDVPDGVEILLPRGGIPAVFEPTFVSVDEADIDDDAWILGVYHNGVAKAYSLNLLNHHEIVNDDFSGEPLAAVW